MNIDIIISIAGYSQYFYILHLFITDMKLNQNVTIMICNICSKVHVLEIPMRYDFNMVFNQIYVQTDKV